jgi:hypothetical protein
MYSESQDRITKTKIKCMAKSFEQRSSVVVEFLVYDLAL